MPGIYIVRMYRKTALLGALAIASSASCSSSGEPAPQADAAPPRPNVIFILADDLGWGDLGCYATDSKVATPRLDALAEQGLRFLDAHSPSSVCSPTRYGILTGRYAWRSELKQSVVWEWGRPLLEPELITLPELLSGEGYRTACIGKWHLGWTWLDRNGEPANAAVGFASRQDPERKAAGARVDLSRPMLNGPLSHGFDHYFGDDVPNFPPRAFIRDDRLLTAATESKPDGMFGSPGPTTPGWELSGVMPRLAEEAVSFVTEAAADTQPFFLYLPLTAPHTPIAPATEFAGTTAAGPYGDYVAQIDHMVGQVLDAVDAAGCADNTLIVFTSDNGSPARDGSGMSGPVHGVTARYGHVPNGPWRGSKADIYEAGHRVPLIVRWPGRATAGQTSDALVGLQDFYATLADALQLPPGNPPTEDSLSFLSAIEDATSDGRASLVHHSIDGTFAIRAGRWKLIPGELGSGGWTQPKHSVPGDGDPGGQLYDLNADPGETKNLWDEHPMVVERLGEELETIRG